MKEELKRILIVEDDRNDLELTINALADNGIVNGIDVVNDGAGALDYLWRRGDFAGRAEGYPVVILLDIKLPKLNGLEVLRQIKEDSLLKSIPTVILTSSKEERDVMMGYHFGANAYVVKPVEFGSFSKAIREIGAFWAILNEAPVIPGRERIPYEMGGQGSVRSGERGTQGFSD